MNTRTRSALAAFAFAAIAAVPARAQDATLVPPATTPVVADSMTTQPGPTMAASAVGVRAHDADARSAAPLMQARTSQRGVPLMIIGVAAVLTGIVVGNNAGHAISVGGAVIGLYGLYQYLQ